MEGQCDAGTTWLANESEPSSWLPLFHLTKPPITDLHAEPDPSLAIIE